MSPGLLGNILAALRIMHRSGSPGSYCSRGRAGTLDHTPSSWDGLAWLALYDLPGNPWGFMPEWPY